MNVATRRESLIAFLCLAILFYSLRALLFTGSGVLPHDNFYWCYPVFKFFAENFVQGRLVLWNPYSHGGEPFYPLMAQLRLWDPLSLFAIFAVSRFTSDTVLWFNWWHILQSLTLSLGIYLLYRPLIKHSAARPFLIPIVVLSSITLTSLAQNAMLLGTIWIPYQALFAVRIFHRRGSGWANWLLLSLFAGMNFYSYFFAATWVFLSFTLVALALFHRQDLVRVRRADDLPAKVASFLVIVGLLALPNFALVVAGRRFVFPLRMAPPNYSTLGGGGAPVTTEGDPSFVSFGIRMPYDFVKFTGGSSSFSDYLQMVEPTGNWILHGDNSRTWGNPSDSYICLGLLGWAIGLYGIFYGRHSRRRAMLFLLGALTTLSLGARGGLHALLYPIFPPLWFLRNTSQFTLLVQITFLYFVCLGLNRLFPKRRVGA